MSIPDNSEVDGKSDDYLPILDVGQLSLYKVFSRERFLPVIRGTDSRFSGVMVNSMPKYDSTTYRRTIASLMGFAIVVDSATGARLTGSLRSIIFLDRHGENVGDLLVLKNAMFLCRNNLNYSLNDLDGIFIGSTDLARTAFRFKKSKHQIVIQVDDRRVLFRFLNILHSVIHSRSLSDNIDKNFNPFFEQYLSIPRIDRNSTDMFNINSLILENIVLPSAPVTVDKMPISYVSLTGSSFGSNSQEDDFWDWIIPSLGGQLTHLEMNSMELKTLPFNIMFLENLQTLSLANNKLTHISHFIGELDNLECLYVNNNILEYLPGCLQDRSFKHLNIRDNSFKQKCNLTDYTSNIDLKNLISRPGKPTCLKLSVLSFFSLINNRVKLSRRKMPFALRHLFDSFCRCRYCNALVMFDSSNETFYSGWVKTLNMTHNVVMSWQCYECRFKCK